MRKMKQGGMLSMLAGMAGKQALSYLLPKVASWAAKKIKGKGVRSLRNGIRPVGRSLRPLGGAGMTLLGKKGKKCAKCSSGNGIMNKLISAAKAVGKRELKNHVNYAIDNPMQSYNDVKKLVMGIKGIKSKKSENSKS